MCVCVCVFVQGLSRPVRQRMRRWALTAPCSAALAIPRRMSQHAMRVGTEAALAQLKVLPAGSMVTVQTPNGFTTAFDFYHSVCLAIQAAGPTAEHITVLPPATHTTDAVIYRMLMDPQPLVLTSLTQLELRGAHAGTAWPWRNLHASGTLDLADLLQLPDPSNGQYDIYVEAVKIHAEKV